MMASNPIGAALGSIVIGFILSHLGYSISFTFIASVWCAGSICAFFLRFIILFVLVRLLKGMAVGMGSTIIPCYFLETINDNGHSLAVVYAVYLVGAALMYSLAYTFVSIFPNPYAFKIPWLLELAPALGLFGTLFFLPEPPRWLASRRRWGEAVVNSAKLHLKLFECSPAISTPSYASLFKVPIVSHTISSVSVHFFTQISGGGSFSFLFLHICDMCGLDHRWRLHACLTQYFIYVLLSAIPISLLSKCRRKDALVFGHVLMFAGYLAAFVVLKVYGEPLPGIIPYTLDRLPASTMLAVSLSITAIYHTVLVPVTWLYLCELYPIQCRVKGLAVSLTVLYLLNTTVTLALPVTIHIMGPWSFLVLCFISLGAAVALTQLPETRQNDFRLQILLQEKCPKTEVLHKLSSGSANASVTTDKALKVIDHSTQSQKGIFKNLPEDLKSVDSSRNNNLSINNNLSRDNLPNIDNQLKPNSSNSTIVDHIQAFTAKEVVDKSDCIALPPVTSPYMLKSTSTQMSPGWGNRGEMAMEHTMGSESPEIVMLNYYVETGLEHGPYDVQEKAQLGLSNDVNQSMLHHLQNPFAKI